tara:strand:+ start:503 stop:676 length:174 start_codon:yes stop_codon:yes gene_type:complete
MAVAAVVAVTVMQALAAHLVVAAMELRVVQLHKEMLEAQALLQPQTMVVVVAVALVV